MTPVLSIVIPTRNRRASLLQTLERLAGQNADPDDFEVVVAADGCTDGTAAAVAALAAGPRWAGGRLRGVEQEWRGAAAARNTGVRAATGRIVLFLDDDILAAANLVAAHLARQEAAPPGGAVVLGRIVPERGQGALHREMDRWWQAHYRGLGQKAARFTDLYTGNVSVPRAAALAVGGLDENLDYGEDVEFGYRLQAHGLPFVYAPEAAVRTRNPKPARALLRDFYRSGQGSVRIYRKLPATLPALPLSAFGETNVRSRLLRGLLLALGARPLPARLLEAAFGAWAGSRSRGRPARILFELARGYFFWSGVRAALADRRAWATLTSWGVPILLYHGVEARPGRPPERYTMAEGQFARQMALLRRLRYRVVSTEELAATWHAGRLPPPRTVAITFDDGYRNNLTVAWPVLRRFGYPATLFLATGSVAGFSTWDPASGQGHRPFITWDEARILDRAGFRVEAHSVSHPDLTQIPPAQAATEIRESGRQIAAALGRPVRSFAYPYGYVNPVVQALVAAAGYRAAFSVQAGLNTLRTSPFDRKRIEIRGDESQVMFLVKLWAGEDPFRYLPGRALLDRILGGRDHT